MNKKRVFSGIQPSGIIHVGNYLGAISQFVANQDKFDNIFCIVDLHAITVPQDPAELRENTYKLAALYLACGIDPKKSKLFVQSQVPQHSELAWILNTITYMGELERMTQYKDKIKKEETGQHSIGLFDYPVLMAADILLYDTDVVPVGEDQKQHVELCRALAKRFNHKFGETFKIPEVMIKKSGARIMGLDNASNKMSKSAPSKYNFVALTDSPDEIRTKIKKAKTDSMAEVKFDQGRPEVFNLLTIYQLFSGLEAGEIEKKFTGGGLGNFKTDLAELIIEKLTPIQNKYQKLIADKKYLDKILADGAQAVSPIAQDTMSQVKKKIGLIR